MPEVSTLGSEENHFHLQFEFYRWERPEQVESAGNWRQMVKMVFYLLRFNLNLSSCSHIVPKFTRGIPPGRKQIIQLQFLLPGLENFHVDEEREQGKVLAIIYVKSNLNSGNLAFERGSSRRRF